MSRPPEGPWLKWYVSTKKDTAHFTDRQFRVWHDCLVMAKEEDGRLPKRAPLNAMCGAKAIDFLLGEGWLAEGEDGHIYITKWSKYQPTQDRTAPDRMRRYRERLSEREEGPETTLETPSYATVTRNETGVTDGYTPRVRVRESPSLSGVVTDDNLLGGPLRAPAREPAQVPAREWDPRPPQPDPEDLPPLTRVIDAIEERTGREWRFRPGNAIWDTLDADVRDFGYETVLARMADVDAPHPDVAQLVFGASKALHPLAATVTARASPGVAKGLPGATRTSPEDMAAFKERIARDAAMFDAKAAEAAAREQVPS